MIQKGPRELQKVIKGLKRVKNSQDNANIF